MNRRRWAGLAAALVAVVLGVGPPALGSVAGAQDAAPYLLYRVAACSAGPGQSDVPGAGVLRITNFSEEELGLAYTTADGVVADAPGIGAGETVVVPIPGNDALPEITVAGQVIDIPAANGCGFAVQGTYDHCPSSDATGYQALIVSNSPDPLTLTVNDEPDVVLEPGATLERTVPFEDGLVATLDGEEVPVVMTSEGCVGPLSILVAEPPCTTSNPDVPDTIVANRVAVPVTFTVNGVEATLDPAETRTFPDTGEDPTVLIGEIGQPLINGDPIIAFPAIGCPVSAPDDPPSSTDDANAAPLGPRFTG